METIYAATFGSVQETGVRWGDTAKAAGRGMASRIKHVLQPRLKISGAAWLPSHAEPRAQLRGLRSNDRWSKLWPLAA